jgi:hypothetical protein
MLNFFKKFKILKTHPIIELLKNDDNLVEVLNDESVIERIKNGDDWVYINPKNQICFNYGRFTLQDIIDWSNGTGVIVKGKTQKEKDKFMKYALAYKELDINLFIYDMYLDILNTDVMLYCKSKYSSSYYQDLSNAEETEVIRLVLSNIARQAKEELSSKIGYLKFKNPNASIIDTVKSIKEKYDKISYTTCHTMSILGKGSFEASNTPQRLDNLSWAKELPFVTAYYEFMKETGYDMPDFKWVKQNYYKK